MIKKTVLLNLSTVPFASVHIQQPTPVFMYNNPVEIVTTTRGWTWFLENLYNPFIKLGIFITLIIIAVILSKCDFSLFCMSRDLKPIH